MVKISIKSDRLVKQYKTLNVLSIICQYMCKLAINLFGFFLLLFVVRKSTRGKRGRPSNKVEELPENTTGEEPTSVADVPHSVTNSVNINIKPEEKLVEENLKTEVISPIPNTQTDETEDKKPNISKLEDEVTVKESIAAADTTEQKAEIKGI